MDLNAFARDIRQILLDGIPVEQKDIFKKKHKGRKWQLFEAVGEDTNFAVIHYGTNGYIFELGSDNLEQNYPHYHILEDAFTIRKKGQGTTTSKGSQDKVHDLSSRDYGAWTVHSNKERTITRKGKKITLKASKSVYKEYRKNVRGNRKPKEKYLEKVNKKTGEVIKINVSPFYINKHYHYIEKAFDDNLPTLAQKYNMRMGRTKINDEEKQEALKSLEL